MILYKKSPFHLHHHYFSPTWHSSMNYHHQCLFCNDFIKIEGSHSGDILWSKAMHCSIFVLIKYTANSWNKKSLLKGQFCSRELEILFWRLKGKTVEFNFCFVLSKTWNAKMSLIWTYLNFDKNKRSYISVHQIYNHAVIMCVSENTLVYWELENFGNQKKGRNRETKKCFIFPSWQWMKG